MSTATPGVAIAQIYSTKTPGEAELEKQLALMTGAIAADLLRLSRECCVALSKIRKRYQQAANLADGLDYDAPTTWAHPKPAHKTA